MSLGNFAHCFVFIDDDHSLSKKGYTYKGVWWNSHTEECPSRAKFILENPISVDCKIQVQKEDLIIEDDKILGWYSRKHFRYQRTVPKNGVLGQCEVNVVDDGETTTHVYGGKWISSTTYEGCSERYFFKLKYKLPLSEEWHFDIEDHDLVYDDDEICGWYSITKDTYTACPQKKISKTK